MYGLDLFSGIGGITKALETWVQPAAYCEQDRYAQAVLLSRMQSGDLPVAPIWDDVQSLPADLPIEGIDIIYGGFPCQDISVAGNGVGLGGKRSGLFFEIVRLAEKIKPSFIFLENVPAIRTRGLDRVIQELTQVGYDCRWTMLSAADIGANHKRERWFLLAHATGCGRSEGKPESCGSREGAIAGSEHGSGQLCKALADTECQGLEGNMQSAVVATELRREPTGWWAIEPNVGRVAHGVPRRVDRLKCLGNAVVPEQAKTAFKILMGLKG